MTEPFHETMLMTREPAPPAPPATTADLLVAAGVVAGLLGLVVLIAG